MILHHSTSPVVGADARAQRSDVVGQPADVYLSFRRNGWDSVAFTVMSPAEARAMAASLVEAACAAETMDALDAQRVAA